MISFGELSMIVNDIWLNEKLYIIWFNLVDELGINYIDYIDWL